MKIIFLLVVLLIPMLALAAGTVSFRNDVKPILMQRPFFAKILLETFEFKDTVIATTIGRQASPGLASHRMGPYRVLARKKSDAGTDYDMVVVINTRIHFLDKSGHETESLKNAVGLREDFDSIEIEPLPNQSK